MAVSHRIGAKYTERSKSELIMEDETNRGNKISPNPKFRQQMKCEQHIRSRQQDGRSLKKISTL